MISVLFLGCVYSETQKELFFKKSRRGYQFAAQNLQESLIEGFQVNGLNLNVLTIPALSTFPRGYKSPFVRDADFVFDGKVLGKSLGFFNIPFKNHIDYEIAAKYIDKWYASTNGKHVIFVYALLGQQMGLAIAAKRRHPDIKLCIMVPDLPRFMGVNKYYKKLGLQEKSINSIYERIRHFDGFVVLAKPMVDDLMVNDKLCTVVEGIYHRSMDEGGGLTQKFEEKTVLYAGGIQSRYGVFDLIEAFTRLTGRSYRLILCGPCQETDLLNEYLHKDKRISYLGLIPTDEARKLQKKATLLVNPRHSDEVFTQYSFPSKTLEYMASGTPVLMSHLSSLPDEYLGHVFLFEDESVDGMAKTIERILSMDSNILNDFGEKASRFILEQKNAKIQVGKIIEMFNRI